MDILHVWTESPIPYWIRLPLLLLVGWVTWQVGKVLMLALKG